MATIDEIIVPDETSKVNGIAHFPVQSHSKLKCCVAGNTKLLQMVFRQQYLVEAQKAKTAELDKQDQLELERFIVSLG